jgi:hypothetical protein
MKAERKLYKGIEYVQLTELPQLQQEQLLETLGHDFFIKIRIDGKIVSQCLQFKDYSRWYENVYAIKSVVAKEPRVQEVIEIHASRSLALNKV